ncbi:hypothetical protein CPC16_000076 [Podila verticillata]|nr:hypothetical protein BGZ52_001863 [Haplosporangium bisporale]KAF9396568.1 hypothetical protein CPC16_000076 [Podila verticillata]KAI9237526.1 MAG: ricin B lectin domain-containing protein [Podila humilis]
MGQHSFPEGREFSIGLRDTNLVLDVQAGSGEPGTPIILWTAKNEDNANQKWIYDDKQLRNKQTGLVLSVPRLHAFETADQQFPTGGSNQKFEYYDHTISAEHDDSLVLGIVTRDAEGERLALINRDDDSPLQQWTII